MSENNFIPFSFCRLNRAADFLGMSSEDLLSLALSEKIILCVRLDGLNSVLLVDGKPDELDQWYLSLKNDGSVLAAANYLSKYTSFSIDRLAYDEETDECVFHPRFYQSLDAKGNPLGNQSQSHKGRGYGLWVPQLPVINSIMNYERSSLLWGSLGLYRTDESTPSLCLIPLPRDSDTNDSDDEDDGDEYEENYPYVEITANDLWITSEQVRKLLNHNGDYSELPKCSDNETFLTADLVQKTNKNNQSAERHAINREKLYKYAICLLSKYPEECRGERKEISPEKWRDCIMSHQSEIPPLPITNEDVILRHLRAATNNKG
ncbi:hypothetical protein [Citrobacter farmeri]|uniref:hypothetical protein n=1 Tax=Citrobacter farmeri TaxID=67824 RepID=UPI00388E0011